jgi:hypothetical protein
MRRLALAALAALAMGVPAMAAADPLAPLAFMVGDWKSVGDSAGPGAGGVSSIHLDLGGRLLVRRDHVLTRGGAAFDIYMVVYADGDHLRAEFIDTEGHVIHYAVTPGAGPSVVFESPPVGVAVPGYRLTYTARAANRLHILFEIAPPPAGAYRAYSEGDVARQ